MDYCCCSRCTFIYMVRWADKANNWWEKIKLLGRYKNGSISIDKVIIPRTLTNLARRFFWGCGCIGINCFFYSGCDYLSGRGVRFIIYCRIGFFLFTRWRFLVYFFFFFCNFVSYKLQLLLQSFNHSEQHDFNKILMSNFC